MRKQFVQLIALTLAITIVSCSSSDNNDVNEAEPNSDVPVIGEEEVIGEKEVIDGGDNIDNENNDTIIEDEGIKYSSGAIIFEPQVTNSALDLWVVRKPGDPKYYDGGDIKSINNDYLEFTGNTLNSGPPTSPLKFSFECKKTAKYRLVARMYQPLSLDPEEAEDKRNDIYIKLEGDFTSASVFNFSTLNTDNKFFGRGVRQWGGLTSLEAGVDGKKTLSPVFYNLKEGERYTFTISGRAQGCSIDYFVLFDDSLNLRVKQHDDIAVVLPEDFRPD